MTEKMIKINIQTDGVTATCKSAYNRCLFYTESGFGTRQKCFKSGKEWLTDYSIIGHSVPVAECPLLEEDQS